MGTKGVLSEQAVSVIAALRDVCRLAEADEPVVAQRAWDQAQRLWRSMDPADPYAVELAFALRVDHAALAVACRELATGRAELEALRTDLTGTPFRTQLGHVLVNLGFVLCESGDFDAAIDVLSEAHTAYPAGDVRHVGDVRLNLGTALLEAGRPREALDMFRAARSAFEAITPLPHRDIADAVLDEGLALEEIGGPDSVGAASSAFLLAMRLYRQDVCAAGDVADCWVNLAVLAEGAASAEGVSAEESAAWHHLALTRYCVALSHYGMSGGESVDLADCQLGLAGVLAGIDPAYLDEAEEFAHHAAGVYADLGQRLRWARAQLRLAELAEKRADITADAEQRRAILGAGALAAAAAATLLEHARYQFESEGERRAWGSVDADNALTVALRLAAAGGDAALLTDLIVTGRFVGALDLDAGHPPRPLNGRTVGPTRTLTSAQPSTEPDDGRDSPGSGGPGSGGPASGAALAASTSTARSLGMSFDRDPGPTWVMPDERKALQGAVDLVQTALKRVLRAPQEAHYR